jgi:hypothetical protein
LPPSLRKPALIPLLLLIACGPAWGIVIATYPAPISANDKDDLERHVCLMLRGVRAEAVFGRSYRPDDTVADGASVLCAPHGVYAGAPLFSFAHCVRNRGGWDCEPVYEAYRTTAFGKPTGMILEGIEIDDALAVLRYLETHTNWVNRIGEAVTFSRGFKTSIRVSMEGGVARIGRPKPGRKSYVILDAWFGCECSGGSIPSGTDNDHYKQ